jgi:hypothetical protein
MMVRTMGMGALAALALVGCAQQQVWHKPGSNQNEFARHKYECLRQAQQPVSGVYVNRFAGVADSRMQANGGLFASCMNAHGWYLTAAASPQSGAVATPPMDYIKQARDQAAQEAEVACRRDDLQAFYAKSACKVEDITLEQMSDTSKIAPEQKEALSKYRTANTAINAKLSDAFLKYGGETGAKVVAARERVIRDAQDYQLKLYEGKLTWGEYNMARHERNKQFQQEYLTIVQGK